MTGKVVWFEVMGKDKAAQRSFYGELFGWQFDEHEAMDYSFVKCEEGQVPGGIGSAPDGKGWATFYISVDDVQAAVDKAASLGGEVVVPPTELPMTTIAMVRDPEGHIVGLAKS